MISIIVVIGENNAIGCKNNLLWKLPGDMKRFKKITENHTVIMGDRTFKSIGFPLPNRKNIVVTRDKKYQAPGCELEFSLENILNKYQNSKEEVFIIGGGQIYKQSLPFTQKLYLTTIEESPEADTFFPDHSNFKNIVRKEKGIDNGHKYTFLELTK